MVDVFGFDARLAVVATKFGFEVATASARGSGS
jgi:predicted alpha/beta hydrolase